MHILSTQQTTLTDEAIDLSQSPADLVFLSAADTELSCLSEAKRVLVGGTSVLSLRLANLGRLTHPLSIDLYCEKTISQSKMVIIRCLGGKSYWSYGLETIHAVCVANSIPLIVLSGDDKWDSDLDYYNTCKKDLVSYFFDYFVEGGIENSISALSLAYSHIYDESLDILPPRPILKAGIWTPNNPVPSDSSRSTIAIIFYRALLLSGNTEPIESLCKELEHQNLNTLPIFVSSLKDDLSQQVIRRAFSDTKPSVVINLTSFAVSTVGESRTPTVLEEGGSVVLQAILSSTEKSNWQESDQGLPTRDLAMSVALPEVDGRILSGAISFKSPTQADEDCQITLPRHETDENLVHTTSTLASNWSSLSRIPKQDCKVAMILANYPNRDSRLGNGVGLDTPASVWNLLQAMKSSGYKLDLPQDDESLLSQLKSGVTNESVDGRQIRETLQLSDYRELYTTLPESVRDQIESRWGDPTSDPFYLPEKDAFALPILQLGNISIGIQPARGYNIDPEQSFHSPDLVPPHNYVAFYYYLRFRQGCDVVAHIGKHGNLEWLPGKALSLSESCFPRAILGPIPHIYPFIVNDPGEGTQAKRRTSAVIIDHLTPPLTRAETYGYLRDLEGLVDEYYEAQGLDQRRSDYLKQQIFQLMESQGLLEDLGVSPDDSALVKLDSYLCELKEAQIRDGLHILGESPKSRLRIDLALSLSRLPRGWGEGGDASLLRAMSQDFNFSFDPLDCDYAKSWDGDCPSLLSDISSDAWRSYGDTIERMELLSAQLLESGIFPSDLPATSKVLESLHNSILPSIDSCGEQEIQGFLDALGGKFVAPAPSGAPSRGRPDVLPTGKNFFSLDSRSVPTQAAWHLGSKSAELLLTRHRQDHGEWPKSLGLSVWGTSNMRTGGDDIAQALALIGVRPRWDSTSRRVIGFEIITPAELDRPRVDVTLRISGFFRDAFPAQIELFDKAVRAVAALDEDANFNPIAANIESDKQRLLSTGMDDDTATQTSGFRIFGSKPGSYGAGLQALIDENGWQETSDFAHAYLAFGGYAYGDGTTGRKESDQFERRLSSIDAVVHNQDNREHDLLDSDDYYQFEGGMSASIEHLRGVRPIVYHNDHSRPERPVIRTLEEEIAKVVRSRVVNPKWISGVMRHKYKGAFEMSASVDYLFAFAATTGAVTDHHFDAVYNAYLQDDEVRDFLKTYNPDALRDISRRLLDALDRDLWTSRSNSVRLDLVNLSSGSD